MSYAGGQSYGHEFKFPTVRCDHCKEEYDWETATVQFGDMVLCCLCAAEFARWVSKQIREEQGLWNDSEPK